MVFGCGRFMLSASPLTESLTGAGEETRKLRAQDVVVWGTVRNGEVCSGYWVKKNGECGTQSEGANKVHAANIREV